MNLKRSIPLLIVAALVFAAGIGIAAYRSVQAAAPELRTSGVRVSAHMGFGRGFGGYDNEDLADALGISTDELNAAYQEAKEAAIAQAVEAGLLTQAQADQLLENGLTFPFGERWAAGWLSENEIDFEALLADALGITAEELQEAYKQARFARIDRAVEEGILTEEQADLMKGRFALFSNESFLSSMRSAFEAAVQQAVDAGVITESQAERILEESEGGLGFSGLRERGFFFDGPGFGRHRGPWEWLPGTPDDSEIPFVTPTDDL